MANEMELSVSRKNGYALVTFETATLRRPLVYALQQTINELESDPDIGAVILTGRKNIFLTGADLNEVEELNNQQMTGEFLAVPHLLITRIYQSSKIMIAAINGYCLGGGMELALACDLRLTVNEVKDWQGRRVPFLGFPEANLGIIPPLGGVHLLAETIGLGQAKQLLLSAQPITAERAYEIGLVNALVSRDQLLAEAENLAMQILQNSALALRMMKHLLHGSPYSRSFQETLNEAADAFARCCQSGEKNDRIAMRRQEQRVKFRKSVGVE